MKKQLVYQDDKSGKFWNIETSGEKFTVTFGKIGTVGQTHTKEFESEEECTKEARSLIKEKLKKRYVEKNKSIIKKEKSILRTRIKQLKQILMPFFGERCVIKNVFKHENGLYFYAFDGEEEKKVCEEIVKQTIGSWDVINSLNIKQENIVMFGVTIKDDLSEEQPEKVSKIYDKNGLIGLIKKLGSCYPGPLFYDRSTGYAYFFPDGSPSYLSKDGKKKQILDKLKFDFPY